MLLRINNHANCLCSPQQGVDLEFRESKQVTAGLHIKGLWLCLGKEDSLAPSVFVYRLEVGLS